MAEAITKITITPDDEEKYDIRELLAQDENAEAHAVTLVNQIIVDKKILVGGIPNVVISEKGYIFEGAFVPAEDMSLELVVLLAVFENGKDSFTAYNSIEEMCAAPQTVIPDWDTPLLQLLEGNMPQ